MSRGSKSAEKHQPYSRKDGPAQQQRANDDDAGGEKKKQKKSNRKRNKEIAFSFHSSWTHPNLFRRDRPAHLFAWQVCGGTKWPKCRRRRRGIGSGALGGLCTRRLARIYVHKAQPTRAVFFFFSFSAFTWRWPRLHKLEGGRAANLSIISKSPVSDQLMRWNIIWADAL